MQDLWLYVWCTTSPSPGKCTRGEVVGYGCTEQDHLEISKRPKVWREGCARSRRDVTSVEWRSAKRKSPAINNCLVRRKEGEALVCGMRVHFIRFLNTSGAQDVPNSTLLFTIARSSLPRTRRPPMHLLPHCSTRPRTPHLMVINHMQRKIMFIASVTT